MALDRVHGDVVFICDTCDETLDTGEHEFEDARVVLREAGWQTRRERGDWLHECPGCQKELFH